MENYHIYDRLVQENITTLDAGYRKFDLKFKRSLKVDKHKAFGSTDWDKGEICLITSQAHVDARETLLHELLHVVLDHVGLGGDEDTDMVIPRTNEQMVTLLTRGLLLLMNLNPKLFAIINEQQPPAPEQQA